MSEAVDLEADLFNLAMSEEAQPLLYAVQKHIAENVDPIVEEFYALNAEKEDRWSWHPRQLELLDGAKAKAKENGLWNFFLPDAETGEGHGEVAGQVHEARFQREGSIGECPDRDDGDHQITEMGDGRVGEQALQVALQQRE